MDVPADSLEVAIKDGVAFVRVSGRGSFRAGPAVKQFGTGALDRGCRLLRVDLASCTGMDSTFMGVLAGLALMARKVQGEVVLCAVSEKNAANIRTLGLGHLVRIEEGSGRAAPASCGVLNTAADRQTLTETMLAAHETLVDVSVDNLPKFKDVLAFLKEDLSSQQAGPAAAPAGPSKG